MENVKLKRIITQNKNYRKNVGNAIFLQNNFCFSLF